MALNKKNLLWLQAKSAERPYWAELTNRVSPTEVEDHGYDVVSAGLRNGIRTYTFMTEQVRDRFVKQFKAKAVEAVV